MVSDNFPVIMVAEHSDLVFEGLAALLRQQGYRGSLQRLADPEELLQLPVHKQPGLVIVNPSLLLNRTRMFKALRKEIPGIRWIALVYGYFPQENRALFDEVIDISVSGSEMLHLVEQQLKKDVRAGDTQSGQLSDREKEVLLLLVHGLQNKEIADKLNISIHTVISHRKNITQKTGIRSQAGLVIYALSNRLVPIEALK
jgi:DNA-binding NarL/FixJ family response regulator